MLASNVQDDLGDAGAKHVLPLFFGPTLPLVYKAPQTVTCTMSRAKLCTMNDDWRWQLWIQEPRPRTPVALANVHAPACTKELSTRLRNQEQEQQAPELSTWQSGARGRGAWSGKMRGFGNWGLGARAPVSSRAPGGATKSRSLHGATSLTCALVVR